MFKWVGRIFYVIFALLFVLVIGNGSGLVQQSYYNNEVLKKIHTTKDAVKNFSSLGNGYLQLEPVFNESYTDLSTKHPTNTKIDFDLSIYPLVVTQESNGKIDSESGFFFVFLLPEGKSLLDDYGIKSIGIVIESTKVSLDEKVAGTPYLQLNDTKPILTISNAEFRKTDEDKDLDFSITGLQVFAYTDNNQRYSLLNLGQTTKESNNDNVMIVPSFELTKAQLDVTDKVVNKSPEELAQNGIYHEKADLSPYYSWYWYVGLIYIVIIIIIPFFLFFRKQTFAYIRRVKQERQNKKDVEKKIEHLKQPNKEE
ncbi:conserved hypothetical protein [Alteracholeplasma palmae J233]|uniref:Uncharacterized protein n=1 Tax=Alteracholeplasma palmae (strain ATCC 49389 / J233) TaxID=1318466 RepID=U4KNJ7_ALTPJ|nr:hypothetical protein [Alteracholeplasma palmae]CCV63765.1 conserved hypothetical protein [Alteracholeplasma palmae J233]